MKCCCFCVLSQLIKPDVIFASSAAWLPACRSAVLKAEALAVLTIFAIACFEAFSLDLIFVAFCFNLSRKKSYHKTKGSLQVVSRCRVISP